MTSTFERTHAINMLLRAATQVEYWKAELAEHQAHPFLKFQRGYDPAERIEHWTKSVDYWAELAK